MVVRVCIDGFKRAKISNFKSTLNVVSVRRSILQSIISRWSQMCWPEKSRYCNIWIAWTRMDALQDVDCDCFPVYAFYLLEFADIVDNTAYTQIVRFHCQFLITLSQLTTLAIQFSWFNMFWMYFDLLYCSIVTVLPKTFLTVIKILIKLRMRCLKKRFPLHPCQSWSSTKLNQVTSSSTPVCWIRCDISLFFLKTLPKKITWEMMLFGYRYSILAYTLF